MASNYRPGSITSIVCRTMEKILRDSMASFLMENNLLSNYQFGFIKRRSTTLQLLNVLNDCTQAIESKNFTDCIYMDYQKAFDKVPHNRLISKLKAYKFNAELLDWVQSYLNPFLTRFFAITSPIKTVFFDNSVTLKTVLICVYRTNWMCLTKTSVVQ